MQRRKLGSSGFDVSTIGLGTWAIGGHMWGGQDDALSIDAIHAAIDHGVNWIDTAPIYGSGHSEDVVGRAVKQLPPSKRPLIFTKFGLGVNSDAPNRSASAADVNAECDGSLRRLGVDHIDLYQLHWPTPQPIGETAAACAALLQAGKIRAVGVSNFSVPQLEEWRVTGVPLHTDHRRTAFSGQRSNTTSSRGAPRTTWASFHTRRFSAVCCSAPGRRTKRLPPMMPVARTRTIRGALPTSPPSHRRDSLGCDKRWTQRRAAVRWRAAQYTRADGHHRWREKWPAGKADRQSRRKPSPPIRPAPCGPSPNG